MIQTLFRLLVVVMALAGMAAKSHADPCSSVPLGTPCDIQQGEPAVYSGVLMTETTAKDLAQKVLDVKTLEAQLLYSERERAADNTKNQEIVYNLKLKLEDAPLPFYQSPWFWLGTIAAFGGGVVLGVYLER